jgi:hypothetical protein
MGSRLANTELDDDVTCLGAVTKHPVDKGSVGDHTDAAMITCKDLPACTKSRNQEICRSKRTPRDDVVTIQHPQARQISKPPRQRTIIPSHIADVPIN